MLGKRMKIQVKGALALTCLLLLLASGFWLARKEFSQQEKDKLYAQQLDEIVAAAHLKDDFHSRVDTLMSYINKNSRHDINEEFYANWRDKTKIAGEFLSYVHGNRETLPPMECSTRASLMGALLESLGYKIRSVSLAHQNGIPEIYNHEIIDVYNPVDHKWESYDPDYNVYWKNTVTAQRSSILDAAIDLKQHTPCNAKKCGWDIASREGMNAAALEDFTSYITIIDRNAGKRITYYRKDIDKDAVLTSNNRAGTFCQLRKKNCRDGFYVAEEMNIDK